MTCFVPTKAAIPTFPQPSANKVVQATTTTVTGNITQPDTQGQNFCHLCMPSGKICSFTSKIQSDKMWKMIWIDRYKRRETKEKK